MKLELCQCNSCDAILIDENPQVDAPLLDVPVGALSMVQLEENGEFFWACPNCETDEFLTDLN
jgi:hypothetical protein